MDFVTFCNHLSMLISLIICCCQKTRSWYLELPRYLEWTRRLEWSWYLEWTQRLEWLGISNGSVSRNYVTQLFVLYDILVYESTYIPRS